MSSNFVSVLAQMEEMATVKLPSQLMNKEEPAIEEFVKRIETLVKERDTEIAESSSWKNFEMSHNDGI